MVGLVLVSHSHEVAEGVAALARQMGGADLSIATAGGLEGTAEEHPIGTDAARILAAIEHAWSEDGVLVLMDLGSAVLSAEMALEFLDPDRREKVRLSGAPFVEGAVSAAVAAKLGRPLDDVAQEALGGLAGKTAHLGVEPPGTEAAGSSPVPDGPAGHEVSLPIVIDLPHGLHARPAARLVQTAGAFDADIRVTNVTAGDSGRFSVLSASPRLARTRLFGSSAMCTGGSSEASRCRSSSPTRTSVPVSAIAHWAAVMPRSAVNSSSQLASERCHGCARRLSCSRNVVTTLASLRAMERGA